MGLAPENPIEPALVKASGGRRTVQIAWVLALLLLAAVLIACGPAPAGSSPPDATPETGTLVIYETAIVSAEVDGPGHFEYNDRLGPETMARIESVRNHAAQQHLAQANETLSPFGYRLEAHFDAEWDRTFYDLYRDPESAPLLPRLSHLWPVSTNTSGSQFLLAAENAPNTQPFHLLVGAGGIEPWQPDENAYLPPVYAGDALARITFNGFPTVTYQVTLDNQRVYSGTALARGAYMPLRSLTAWEGHWALEVDDHLVVDGQDLGQARGYDAAYGFALVHDQPFYFFEQDGLVHISYGGQTLPDRYYNVFHDQCCEAAIHNVESHGDAVLFHALREGTWHFVEAGVYASMPPPATP